MIKTTLGGAAASAASNSAVRIPAKPPKAIASHTQQSDRLCELNVIEQATHVCQSSIVQDAWDRGQPLTVHGWIYGLQDGLLKDLNICVRAADELKQEYDRAILGRG